tara:strand:- start:206 stop:352 length:147 start_codon:yes stop_codon:yes gene_type:complete
MSDYNVTRTVSGYRPSNLRVEKVHKIKADREDANLAWEVYQAELEKQK